LAFDGFQDCELYRYGFSRNKWVDYAMAGLPIVAAYRGYPNLIDRAGCGVNVPPGDPHALAEAIERFFYLSVAKRRCIGARGKAYVLQHRRYESMLAELLAVDGLTQQD
jgi:glycosyltransferase involved in cell wall biosynthesis